MSGAEDAERSEVGLRGQNAPSGAEDAEHSEVGLRGQNAPSGAEDAEHSEVGLRGQNAPSGAEDAEHSEVGLRGQNAPSGAENRGFEPERRAHALIEALPYIDRFRGAVIVVKLGGNAMVDPQLSATFAEDIVLLRSVGMKPVVVHGGGPQIGDLLERLGKKSEFRDGLRVTDAETLDVARMVLVGKVGRDIVGAINVHGAYAVGLSGEDGGLITASARAPELGFVGDIVGVDPTIVERLLAEEMIPVVSTIGSDAAGQAYNINADTVAGALAGALGAEKAIYLTDVPGLLLRVDDAASIIAQATTAELRDYVADGTIAGGMIPKVDACIAAVEAGARAAHMLDGRVPHVLLLELFTDAGIGTKITTGDGQ